MVPFFEISHVTASKMLSASGSMVNRMNSFTDTTGFMTGAACWGAAVSGGGVDERDEEQAANTPATKIAVRTRLYLAILRLGDLNPRGLHPRRLLIGLGPCQHHLAVARRQPRDARPRDVGDGRGRLLRAVRGDPSNLELRLLVRELHPP